jgi:iron-sulfur cluster repair protein YtfE (RIC family)
MSNRLVVFSPEAHRDEVVGAYPELAETCDRIGLGARTIGEHAQPWWMLYELARSARPPVPGKALDWHHVQVPALIDDIVLSHHWPMRHELRRLRILLSHALAKHPQLQQIGIEALFGDFERNLVAHLDHEEDSVFPLCRQLDQRRAEGGQPVPDEIATLGLGHLDTAAFLYTVIGRVLPLAKSTHDGDLITISSALSAMLQDFSLHQFKEDGVLLPMVAGMPQIGVGPRYL